MENIQAQFQGMTEALVDRSPFFSFWTPTDVSPALSRKFLLSFDLLVKSFPSLIATGAGRMEDEKARLVLAVNLYQESGEGDLERTHHAIYRKFLRTAGFDLTALPEDPFAVLWKNRLTDYLQQAHPGSVLGALAAGEFLAQPALGRLYPVLKDHYPDADQEYFTKHLVLETEHVEEITALLAGFAGSETGWKEVLQGFEFGLSVWETYFNNLAHHLTGAPPPHLIRH
ncbi:MAG TPA: iron-containing redox enzyme family protein [bacterium]|nr:iron-containing redox enzyme family protein [bacterium]